MRTKFLDEIGDTIFAIAMAAGIGIAESNLAIQVTKERAVRRQQGSRECHDDDDRTSTAIAPKFPGASPN